MKLTVVIIGLADRAGLDYIAGSMLRTSPHKENYQQYEGADNQIGFPIALIHNLYYTQKW